MRKCGKCGQSGHNIRTCGKPSASNNDVPKESKGQRRCGKCSQFGHNSRTCLGLQSTPISSELTEGHKILQEQRKKIHKSIDGVQPRKGMWLVNFDRKRIAGYISQVKRKGTIIWHDFSNHDDFFIRSEPETFERSGYTCVEECPSGVEWIYLNKGAWEKEI